MVQRSSSKQSTIPVIGGVLMIIGSVLCSVIGAIGLIALSVNYPQGIGVDLPRVVSLAVGGVIGFLSGLVGGTMAIRRRIFVLSIAGAFIMMVMGFVNVWTMTRVYYSTVMSDALLVGLPIILLSVFGLISVAISRDQFS